MRCLTTLLQPDEGTATVAGIDVVRDPVGVRSRIGLSGQYAAVDEHLTAYENLVMIGRRYHPGKAAAQQRAGAAQTLRPDRVRRPSDHGRAITHGTADELKARTGGERIEVVLADLDDRDAALRIMAEVSGPLRPATASARRSTTAGSSPSAT